MNPAQAVKSLLSSIVCRPGADYGGLSVYPMSHPAQGGVDYITLDEALKTNAVTITETSMYGSVPELVVTNHGRKCVLIIDGEELIGAKQNRVVNTTVLIAAGTQIVVPVSCVERSRWSHGAYSFRSENTMSYSRLRARKSAQVTGSLSAFATYRSDQDQIWNDIELKMCSMGIESPTKAMRDILDRERVRVSDYVGALSEAASEGAAFLIHDQLAGIDLFDRPETFSKVKPKIIASYALDAIERRAHGEKPVSQEVCGQIRAFLEGLKTCEFSAFPSVGLGTDVRIKGKDVTGFALVHEGVVVHLSVFSQAAYI